MTHKTEGGYTEKILENGSNSPERLYLELGQKLFCKEPLQTLAFTIGCVMSPTGIKFPVMASKKMNDVLDLNVMMAKIKNIMATHIMESLDTNLTEKKE